MFPGVNVVGAVVDSKLGGIGDCQFLFPLRGPWHRLRACIIPVKILGSSNSKPRVPWLTKDIVKNGKKIGFLTILVYQTIKKTRAIWNESKDPSPYDNSIVPKDTTFARSKKEKTHTWKEKEYEKYLGVTESIRSLILQTVEEPYLEALKWSKLDKMELWQQKWSTIS